MKHLYVDPLNIEIRGDKTILERFNENTLLFIHISDKEVFKEMMRVTATFILRGGDTVTVKNAYTDLWEMLNYEMLPELYLPTFVETVHAWIDDQITLVELQKD